MSTKDEVPSSIGRIVGLKSEEGKKRNGSACRANVSKRMGSGEDTRHAVCVDGFPGPMSTKAINIDLFPGNSPATRRLSVGVGRKTFLDATFMSTLVVNDSKILDRAFVTGGAARSRGNLQAMEMFVQRHNQQTISPVLVKVTDLNIARAINRVSLGEENVKLAAPLNMMLQNIIKKFPVNKSATSHNNNNVLVKFDSHRISEDRFQSKSEKLGPQRFEATKLGSYQIYPCALKQYLDAHEVRYVDLSGKRKNIVMNHEIYLDYGTEEATAYARHAAALEETYRLFPAVLAEVDPQAFWSAILWLTPFIKTLQELQLSTDLIHEWKALESGKEKSQEYFNTCMTNFGYELPLKGAKENWGITKSQDVHLRIATDYAIGAVDAIQMALVDKCPSTVSSVSLHTLDYYIGTELDNYIMAKQKFHEMTRNETQETGAELSNERIAKLFNKAMKASGFGRDSKFRIQNPEKVCANCGLRSKKKLLTCARCDDVSYCNTKCQKEHWKQHRSNCSRVLVQIQKEMQKMNINQPGGPKVDVELYPYGSSSLPKGPGMFSEVSGIGMMGIFWNPGSTSRITLSNSNPSDLVASSERLKDAARQGLEHSISFNEFSELHPTIRFLVCCGPLPQMDIAQQCVSDAMRFCDGKIGELRAASVGFTALEWAAKKGNMDIVKWLCTDERTKSLIHIGCPIGWAGYTGQIEIMRLLVSHGADPGKTDPVLWSETPPLMVAAQNGQLDALKFYVDECKQDVGMIDQHGKNILKHIESSPSWRDMPPHKACHKWTKTLLRKSNKKW